MDPKAAVLFVVFVSEFESISVVKLYPYIVEIKTFFYFCYFSLPSMRIAKQFSRFGVSLYWYS
jgi:hypothetical protein